MPIIDNLEEKYNNSKRNFMPIIDNLEEKLNGEIPINLNELFILVNSWGRSDWFYTRDKDEKKIKINNSEKNKCYTHLL